MTRKGEAMRRNRQIKKSTVFFLTFMTLFFMAAGFLTYYSNVVYLNTLPRVDTVMPEATGEYENGRMVYRVPADAIHQRKVNSYYILTARYVRDDLGERCQAAEVAVWLLGESGDGWVQVDGIVWEEPVLIGTGDKIQKWDFIRVD